MSNKILIVDDEPEIREVIAYGLELRGYEIVEASGGHEAIELIKEGDIFAVLSDLRMPEGDGIELTEKIRELGFDIPVILMTGLVKIDDEKFKSLSVQHVLNKPFAAKAFMTALDEDLKKAG